MAFTAEYPGTCADCGQHFPVGTKIDYAPKVGWVHAKCPVSEQKHGKVCPTCFEEMPLTGLCPNCTD